MTVKSPTKFDVEEFARAYGQWDVDALIGLYADDLELVQIDRDNPPSAPRAGSRTLDGLLGASRRGVEQHALVAVADVEAAHRPQERGIRRDRAA